MKALFSSIILTGFIFACPSALAQTTADESFDLNITQRRIVESNFKASTAVEVGEQERGLRLSIGTSLTASRINVMLRDVTGRVRFRATLEPVLRRLRVRR